MVESEGRDALSMRGVAGRLGVTPMALYRHVNGVEDVVNELVERAAQDAALPEPVGGDWREALEWLGLSYFELLTCHPLALRAYLEQPVTTPRLRAMAQPVLQALQEAGFDNDAAVAAYRSVLSLAVGFASLRSKWWSPTPPSPERLEGVTSTIRQSAAEEGLPAVSSLAARLASPYPTTDYQTALTSLIEGFTHHTLRRA